MGDAIISYEKDVEDHARTINKEYPPVRFIN